MSLFLSCWSQAQGALQSWNGAFWSAFLANICRDPWANLVRCADDEFDNFREQSRFHLQAWEVDIK